jgi:netrin receptor unc-5
MTSMWIPTRQLACGCPTIKPGESYLVLDELENGGKSSTSNSRRSSSIAVKEGLILDKKTLVIEWRRDWRRRMKRFKKRSRKYCRGS